MFQCLLLHAKAERKHVQTPERWKRRVCLSRVKSRLQSRGEVIAYKCMVGVCKRRTHGILFNHTSHINLGHIIEGRWCTLSGKCLPYQTKQIKKKRNVWPIITTQLSDLTHHMESCWMCQTYHSFPWIKFNVAFIKIEKTDLCST